VCIIYILSSFQRGSADLRVLKTGKKEETMLLTSEVLRTFKEGTMVMENKKNEYFARGKVMNLTVTGNKLEITFLLFAFGWTTGRIDFPTMPQEWVLAVDKRFLSWVVDLNNYTSKDTDPLSGDISFDEEGNFTMVSLDHNQKILFRPLAK
jgi:hypothetical protein